MGLFVDRHGTLEAARADFSWNEAWDIVDGDPDDVNVFHECIARHDGMACQIMDADGQTEQLSFADIARRAGRFTNLLQDEGIEQGENVGIVLEPSIDFLAAFFGTLRHGSVAIPCPAYFGPDAVHHRLVDHPAALLIAPDTVTESLDDSRYGSVVRPSRLPDRLSEYDPAAPTASTSGSDRSWIQFTSGTTGRPTPVPFQHDSAVYWAPFMDFQVDVGEEDRFYTTASPGWGPGIWAGLFGPTIFGRPTGYAAGKFDPALVLDALERFDITSLVGVAPTALRKLVNEATEREREHVSLKAITYTGEPMDAPLSREISDTFDAFPRGFYGITEMRGNITADYCFPDYEEKHGSLGQPVIGTAVAIFDEDGNELPDGETGSIGAKRSGEWFVSDDLGYRDEDGYFWSAGRADDVIISAGYTIGPSVVEDAIRKHDAVDEAGVIGVPHDERGNVVKAFVSTTSPPPDGFEEGLQEFVKSELSKHEYPREIEIVDDIPTSGWGKINRKELRAWEGLEGED